MPASLVRAVIKQESAFRPKALSRCGARGLMQVMPGNALKLGLADEDELWVPRLNVLAGVRLLAVLLKHYEGDVIASLVAYNSGPKAKFAPVPANGETPEYVLRILRYWRAFESERTSALGVPSSR
ncbi:MAG: lytic transglycosylase domain-containing protein [Myxococcales bacterium]|nr:lytic transglycosylase domain-containing protein [Myxococcales bacterium]